MNLSALWCFFHLIVTGLLPFCLLDLYTRHNYWTEYPTLKWAYCSCASDDKPKRLHLTRFVWTCGIHQLRIMLTYIMSYRFDVRVRLHVATSSLPCWIHSTPPCTKPAESHPFSVYLQEGRVDGHVPRRTLTDQQSIHCQVKVSTSQTTPTS